MPQADWKQDPRLKNMDPAKLDYITSFADKIRHTQKSQMIPTFLAMQADIRQKGINFTDSETELLVSILTADMTPAEKQKLETLKFLAKKLAARSS